MAPLKMEVTFPSYLVGDGDDLNMLLTFSNALCTSPPSSSSLVLMFNANDDDDECAIFADGVAKDQTEERLEAATRSAPARANGEENMISVIGESGMKRLEKDG